MVDPNDPVNNWFYASISKLDIGDVCNFLLGIPKVCMCVRACARVCTCCV